jgi:hypothetical protein
LWWVTNNAAVTSLSNTAATIKLSSRLADLFLVSGKHQLPDEPVRSKGQATVLPDGSSEFPTTIRDVSASGIGVIAPGGVNPGTRVRVDTHGHAAHGVVQSCQPEGNSFYIVIELDPAA